LRDETTPELEPVAPPPPHPGNQHIIGNRIRWIAHLLRYKRYLRELEQRRERRARWVGAVLGFWLQ
jgi:hypothetical protein